MDMCFVTPPVLWEGRVIVGANYYPLVYGADLKDIPVKWVLLAQFSPYPSPPFGSDRLRLSILPPPAVFALSGEVCFYPRTIEIREFQFIFGHAMPSADIGVWQRQASSIPEAGWLRVA